MNRFSRYPFPYYNNYYSRNNYYKYNRPPAHNQNISNIAENIEKSTNSHNSTNLKENVWFDIFGIKLYFDDVLILSLLFFLYKEEVKDEGLFLALILLLIS